MKKYLHIPIHLVEFWYPEGIAFFLRTWKNLMLFLEEDLAVTLMFKLLFVPLFHDSSFAGRILSFFFSSSVYTFSQNFKEELEKEASMTLADKAKRDEEWAREDRKFMADWFEDGIKRGGESSETLIIKPDGTLDHKKRLDEGFGTVPFIASAGKLEKPEDLYKLMAKISEEHPQLSISVESDPNMQWIKYKVLKKK